MLRIVSLRDVLTTERSAAGDSTAKLVLAR